MVRRLASAVAPLTQRARLAVLALGLAASAGCSDDGRPRCVAVDALCVPRYQPTFANVYENTLKASCGSQSAACHSAVGHKGGLSMESAEVAYVELLKAERVIAGDASCSEVVVRLHGAGESYLMPPGAPLADADRCAIEQWINDGAAAPQGARSPEPGAGSAP